MVAASGRPSATLAIIVNRTILPRVIPMIWNDRGGGSVAQSSSRRLLRGPQHPQAIRAWVVTTRRCGRRASTPDLPRQSIRPIRAPIARPTTIAYPSSEPSGFTIGSRAHREEVSAIRVRDVAGSSSGSLLQGIALISNKLGRVFLWAEYVKNDLNSRLMQRLQIMDKILNIKCMSEISRKYVGACTVLINKIFLFLFICLFCAFV